MSLEHVEREVKLDAGARTVIPDLTDLVGGIRVERLPDARLRAVYFDTEGLRLARYGASLRRREDRLGGETGERGWTLKLPMPSDGKGLVRRELYWPGGRSSPPLAATRLVRAFRLDEPLGAVATLVTSRRRVLLKGDDDEPLLEIDDDMVTVMDGRRIAARFREIEVEVVGQGGARVLDPVLERLNAAGALPGDGLPKIVRALGHQATEPPDVSVRSLSSDCTVKELVAQAIAAGYARLVEHDPGVRLDEDIEDVHQARVATRRLRSDLRTLRVLLDEGWLESVGAELGWLGGVLGRVRDNDVLGARIAEHVKSLRPEDQLDASVLFRRLSIERRLARRELIAAMDSDRYIALLDVLAEAAVNPPLRNVGVQPAGSSDSDTGTASAGAGGADGADGAGGDGGDGDGDGGDGDGGDGDGAGEHESERAGMFPASELAAEVLPRLIRKPWKRLARTVAGLDAEPSDAELHQVRIMAKRLRYACEVAQPVLGRQVGRLASEAAALQTILGDHHDAVHAEEWLRKVARSSKRNAALAIGQIIAIERAQQELERGCWASQWRRLARKSNRSWLERPHSRR